MFLQGKANITVEQVIKVVTMDKGPAQKRKLEENISEESKKAREDIAEAASYVDTVMAVR